MKHISTVIFDLDGVITDTAEHHYLAWSSLAEELNIPFDREFNEKLKGMSRIDSLNMILEHGGLELKEEEKTQQAIKKNEHYQKMIKNITPEDLLPGIIDFMKGIEQAGLKTASASASRNAKLVVE